MSTLKAYAVVEFYCELPDDEAAADREFDAICDNLLSTLTRYYPGDTVYDESFSIGDADTKPEGLE